MLYEKLLTAVEETSTFGLEWGGSGTSGVFMADDVTFPVHHHLILVSHVFIFENKTKIKINKSCAWRTATLYDLTFMLSSCFQWTASLYAIEKQLSQGFCISLHTSIDNNENTNASYTTLDQMLINVYFHLRWLKNKKKTSSSIPSFYIHPYLLNQFIAHLTSWLLNPVLGAGQIYHHPSLFSLYVLSIWKTPTSKTEIFVYELMIHISCISWNWPRYMVQIRPSKTKKKSNL